MQSHRTAPGQDEVRLILVGSDTLICVWTGWITMTEPRPIHLNHSTHDERLLFAHHAVLLADRIETLDQFIVYVRFGT